jgi:hypothetical protein
MTVDTLTTEYISVEQLKATLELTNTVFAQEDLTWAVTAASRGIDDACKRRFYPDTADVDRYYSPHNWQNITIDDLITLTSLTTDQNGDGTFPQAWTLNTDFILEPLNAAADGRPYTGIRMHPRHVTFGLPAWWPRSVKVTGKFGWAATPGTIVQATTILAAQLVKRAREAPFGVVAIGLDVGAISRIAVTDPTIKFLLADYIRERPQL